MAALDLGTSFSGYAFISTWNPEDVRMNKMLGRESYRTATCILTERGDQGKYVEFGKNAQDLYSRSLSPGQIHCYDLYENFKMVLYNQKVGFKDKIYDHRQSLKKKNRLCGCIRINILFPTIHKTGF